MARLYCPVCGDWLVPAAALEHGATSAVDGDLACLGCEADFRWRDGVLWLGEGDNAEPLARWFRLTDDDLSFLGLFDATLAMARNSTRTFEDEQYALLSWLDPTPGHNVLMLGCDDGRMIPALAEAVFPGLVIALDSDIELLGRARRACQRARATNVVLVQANLSHPPVRPGTFDRLLMLGVLHGLGRPTSFVERVARSLVPEGVVAGLTLARSILPQIAQQQRRFGRTAGIEFTEMNRFGVDLCRGDFDRFQMDQASNWMARFVVHRDSDTLAAGRTSGWIHAARTGR